MTDWIIALELAFT